MTNQSNDRENKSTSNVKQQDSGTSNTQNRSGEKTKEGMSGGTGSPDQRNQQPGNKPGGQGNINQQSNQEREGGTPSRQTSSAQDQKGQA